MRILFTFVAGHGHFEPLVPIARAAEAAGHSVAFGCGSSLVPIVEAANFRVFATSQDTSSRRLRIPTRPLDSEREDREFRERFARRAARHRVPPIIALFSQWQPDVVVCDETDFGAVVGAERAGVPFATVLVIAAGSFVRTEVVGEALNELRAEHGLPPDPELAMLSRYLVLSPFPPSFRDPAYPLPATAHSFRPTTQQSTEDSSPAERSPPAEGSLSAEGSLWPEGSAPAWSAVLPGAPNVYFTLGTVFNLESGDLLARVLAVLREIPVNLVVTVGHEIDPAEFGPQPDHVLIEQHIAQSSLLPHCDVVVSHGGSGSVMGALAHGLPSVLIPLGADQPLNARRCEQLVVAQVLDALAITPRVLRAAVSTVLRDPRYRQNAGRLRDEIAALPPPTHVVRLLERLAASKQPIFSA